MSTIKYSRVPTEPPLSRSPDYKSDDKHADPAEGTRSTRAATAATSLPVDARFNPPPPSPLKRAALLLFLAFLFWLAYKLRVAPAKSDIVHAHRYSENYRFRPAASPIITEKLKNGKLRVRGAQPAARNY